MEKVIKFSEFLNEKNSNDIISYSMNSTSTEVYLDDADMAKNCVKRINAKYGAGFAKADGKVAIIDSKKMMKHFIKSIM